jgi:hypothetical protein
MGGAMVASFVDDLRFAVRSYVKTPGFTSVAVLTLALGTGVNATVFTFVNALLFRPAAVPDPQSLVSIYTSDFSSGPYGDTSYPDFRTLQSDTTVFNSLAAHDGGASALLQTADSVARIRRAADSPDFFHTLRIAPRSGRLIGPEDFADGATPAVVISEDLWRRVLGSAPDVLHQYLSIDGRNHAVVGVLPGGFVLDLGPPVDVWIPLPSIVARAGRGDRNLSMLGRLRGPHRPRRAARPDPRPGGARRRARDRDRRRARRGGGVRCDARARVLALRCDGVRCGDVRRGRADADRSHGARRAASRAAGGTRRSDCRAPRRMSRANSAFAG